MPLSRRIITSFLGFLFSSIAVATDIDAGYDAYAAAQAMINKASQSWEWGTTAEALLELYNSELSVFSTNPFPSGKVPSADPSIFALKYAKQFINVNGQVFVGDSAVGDPASLGVSAILIGQSDSAYLDASSRQADYILNQAPRWSNGAISQRPDVAEIWADNMAMSFPFLAYLAVQTGNITLMDETVTQCGLHRAVLKTSQFDNWQHIIGPQSQDTGLWSTGNGWASYGMVRVLHTLQKWSGSASMTSQANQLKTWIQEILDGALLSGFSNNLLHNYLNDGSWFGEISGTALLSAVAYRMAVNDPSMFPQKYINWADTNRKALASYQGADGIFSPTVDPYNWLDRTEYTSGSPEGQAFTVYLYTAYRDCVSAGVCAIPTPSVSTISKPGIGPIDVITQLYPPITFAAMSAPTGTPCGAALESCDVNGCAGVFDGLVQFPVCTAGPAKGCQCVITSTTCGAHQDCDLHGCAGEFNGYVEFAQCTGNFIGCNCTATDGTCGAHQSCDLHDCVGKFNGEEQYAQCSNNFLGCSCAATANTCGPPQNCDINACAGEFDLSNGKAYCSQNFIGCECTATEHTCGNRQSCDQDNCDGAFSSSTQYPQCTNFFKGCDCDITSNTCGSPQDCNLNGCAGFFDLSNGIAYCSGNFLGCECTANPSTCGVPQSCDQDNCRGAFLGLVPTATCTDFFNGCACEATSNTCGNKQSCDNNGCAGGYDSNGVARCQGNFQGCECNPTSNTCGHAQNCDLDGCAGTFDSNSNTARCRGNYAGCVCIPVGATCGAEQSCSINGCNGAFNREGNAVCMGNFYGCPCNGAWVTQTVYPNPPIWVTQTVYPQPSQTPGPPPYLNPWYAVGLYEFDDCSSPPACSRTYSLGARNMISGERKISESTGVSAHSINDLCGAIIGDGTVVCNGDITKECQDPGVATYNSRTCRTYCPSLGDNFYAVDAPFIFTTMTLVTKLVCDRALS